MSPFIMVTYSLAAYLIICFGFAASVYMAVCAWRNRASRVLFLILIAFATCDLWIGLVYVLTGVSSMSTLSNLTTGAYIRPILPMLILLPIILVQRLKL